MINTCCVLTNWWIFIIMSWRLRAVINAVESFYETLHCGSATGETIIPIMANLFLLPPVDIMKLYFQEIELPIQGQMSFISLTCSAPSHSSVRAEVMHFYRDTQQRIWKQVLVTSMALKMQDPHKVTQCEIQCQRCDWCNIYSFRRRHL